jgi:PAS domain-containing protein
MPYYRVKPGDCLSSIAQQHGLRWESVWALPENASLRERRPDPNVIFAGDQLFLPDKASRSETAPSGARHRFVRRGIPEVMRVILEDLRGEPMADVAYTATFDDQSSVEGRTDGTGLLEVRIPPEATRCTIEVQDQAAEGPVGVLIGCAATDEDGAVIDVDPEAADDSGVDEDEDDARLTFVVELGRLDPPTEISGVQQRLNNLGYDAGPEDGIAGERTRAALAAFQRDHDLDPNGEATDATRELLERKHHS